jgi:hypothetical protein
VEVGRASCWACVGLGPNFFLCSWFFHVAKLKNKKKKVMFLWVFFGSKLCLRPGLGLA